MWTTNCRWRKMAQTCTRQWTMGFCCARCAIINNSSLILDNFLIDNFFLQISMIYDLYPIIDNRLLITRSSTWLPRTRLMKERSTRFGLLLFVNMITSLFELVCKSFCEQDHYFVKTCLQSLFVNKIITLFDILWQNLFGNMITSCSK